MAATMNPNGTAPTLLTLPAELRNAIYAYVFASTEVNAEYILQDERSPFAHALKLDDSPFHSPRSSFSDDADPAEQPYAHLRPLQVCRQMHTESALYALSHTIYHLPSSLCDPSDFFQRTRCLSPAKLSALTHLTLSAKIGSLRVLNESWQNLPFGHPSLRLQKLTLIPLRPDAAKSVWGEIADLSQAHTLAYILGETFRGLRNVAEVEVLNRDYFRSGVWELVYRTLCYRMFRWGGSKCGVRFEGPVEEANELGGVGERGQTTRFRVFFGEGEGRGTEVGEEVCRLLGQEGTDPRETEIALDAGVGP
ncbi:hypothetical protein B0A48_17529 [Cryoendolithus antarcticus]|uniref:DUF7730 domain-containing protein n=1 Tax=Cryoendolithus antarcticus TaxID=1507870 RepID=A0A1V8SBM6_9PEZI|nr:hypothetical protein B0A48_17529 [Cryoendolithus antarcticus]